MTQEFKFNNGTSVLTLTPQDDREKALIRLFAVGRALKIGASSGASPESLVIISEQTEAISRSTGERDVNFNYLTGESDAR